MASSTESPQSVLDWCKSLGLNPKKTAVVGPMIPKTKEEFIYKILDADGSIYRPRVVASRRDPDGILLNVLVDSPGEINRETCARGVQAEDHDYWQIVLPDVPEEKELSDSEDEVGGDLENPNPLCSGTPQIPAADHSPVTKRLFDVIPETKLKYTASCESLNSAGRSRPLSDVVEAAQLVEVLAQVGENLRQLAYNGNYKRLKIFSGMEPTPPGEETFEAWRDAALVAITDWPGSGPALCRKIQESLRGPALDLIKLHREVCPQDGPEKLIEVLEDTYGPVEDEIEMLYKFQSCMQKEKENLSEYLKRLQQMLKLLVCRRIIATDRVDSMRLQQLFRGALSMDPTAVMLRSFYRGKKEPTYQELIREIRKEEVNVLRREKKSRGSERTYSDSQKAEEIAELKKQVAQLKARVSEKEEGSTMSRTSSFPKAGGARGDPPKCFRCGRLGHISPHCPTQRENAAATEVISYGCDVRKPPQKRYRKRRNQVRCYTCGWYGHTSHTCDWGRNEDFTDVYVTSFPCEVDICEEKSCGTRMVSEHSGIPNKSKRLGLGMRRPSGRGSVRAVSEKAFPCVSPPKVRENKNGEKGQARTLPIQAGGECREVVLGPCTYPPPAAVPCRGAGTETLCCELLPSNKVNSKLRAAGSCKAAWERKPEGGDRKSQSSRSCTWAQREEQHKKKLAFGTGWYREGRPCTWRDRDSVRSPDWRNKHLQGNPI
uniref:CCHC-type domain-containing protein n=1 Tax=Xenopus tropicalis TaxID=8364 RepID=A0A803JUU6_XENTR